MAYYDNNLHGADAADLSTAVVPSDLPMHGFGQFSALRPSLMTHDLAVFYDRADIAALTERIGFDVPVDQLHRIEVKQDNGLVTLSVEFRDPEYKKNFFAQDGARQLQDAAESLVRRAGNPFFGAEEELPIPETPGLDSRGKLHTADDIRRTLWKHQASGNESARALLAERKGPPSWGGDTWDGVHNNADGPNTVRQRQRNLLGEEPSPLVKKIQDRADRAMLEPQRTGPLLREKESATRSNRLEVKRHPRVKDTPPSEPSR